MDLLKEKQKQLKELLDDKNKLEDLLDNLKLQKEALTKEKDQIDSKINTSVEFKKCVASFQNNVRKENKIIKNIITFILVLLVILINILSKKFFDLINFPINMYFIALASFVETIAVIDVLILKPNYDYKVKLNANDQMKKYILSNEEETTLYSRIDRIKQENILIEQQINIKYSEKEVIEKRINTLLFELLNEEKIKDLIIQDMLNTKDNFDKEINIILDDFDKSIVRTKN